MVDKTTHADGFEKGQEDGYARKEFDPYVVGYMSGFKAGSDMAQRLVRIGEQARRNEEIEKARAERRERINWEAAQKARREKMYKDETGTNL